ncbi:hypothetical protein M5K25_005026 [Dendrobium thyrsiflorum]|uniref:Uncharacterized protein n=1 Tax=Dendrobium thyrsiflorum TaxID=117978 RepID=A0ABD0VGD5_DENTH
MKLEMSPIGPAAPASERAGEPKLEPGRSAADSQNDRRWNLRSRTNARRTSAAPLSLPAKASERTMRLRSEHSEKKKKKQRFSISLSREEIEEDIFAFTGSRPRRRPKKRPRNVQWQLDALFPGFSLSEITPELYKVAE